MEEPYLEALKEEYIGHGGRTLFEMIKHLWTKISKVTNRYKVQLKKEVFITWEQPKVLSAYFKQIDKTQTQLGKWKEMVSDDDIAIHVVDQMYELDWVFKETMTKLEEINNNKKHGAGTKSSSRICTLQGKGKMMQKDKHKTASTKSGKSSETFM